MSLPALAPALSPGLSPGLSLRPGQPTSSYRIAHFTDTYLPRRDGVVTSLHTLRAAMAAAGCADLTVAPYHGDQAPDPALLTIGSLPCGPADIRVGGWPRANHVRRVADWCPDLIHVHTPGPIGLLGVFTARRLGLPLVHTYHTDLHAYADAYRMPASAVELGLRLYARRLGTTRPVRRPGAQSRRHAALDALNELLMGDADAVVVPTAAVLSRAELPVPTERIFLVPAAVSTPELPLGAAARFRAQFGIAADDQMVLCVGRVNREKGIELLMPAFARAASAAPAARLVLVGAVYERRWLRRLIADHGLADRIVVTGQLPPEQVAAAYACAAVLAFPSRTDTQGLVLQEAALAGVPSLLADPQLRRTGALGDAALLAEATPHGYGDALAALLNDPQAARRAGARARSRAQRHRPRHYAAAMHAVYAHALRLPRPDPHPNPGPNSGPISGPDPRPDSGHSGITS